MTSTSSAPQTGQTGEDECVFAPRTARASNTLID
jgi:hypothetical protein